jgi:hypothetical protein
MAKIFESPDRGETVYVREEGSTDRTLYSESTEKQSLHDRIMEDQLWGNIRRAALTNQALQIALERVKVIYALTDHYEKRYGNRKSKD